MWSDEKEISGKPTFGESYYNDGSYSTFGEKFTSTLPGLYSFTMTATKTQTSRWLVWHLQHRSCSGAKKNERKLTLYDLDGDYETASVSVLWQISARDTVAVEHEEGKAYCDSYRLCALSAFRINWVRPWQLLVSLSIAHSQQTTDWCEKIAVLRCKYDH